MKTTGNSQSPRERSGARGSALRGRARTGRGRLVAGLAIAALAAGACASPGVSDVGAGTGGGTPTPVPSGSATPSASPTPATEVTCPADPSAAFPAQWINGADCTTEEAIQVWRYDANTWILRQSMCTNFEGPFLYLFFGTDRALMEDTGAGGIQIGAKVDEIRSQWLQENGRTSIPLTVVNSHAHGDHTAGNSQLAALADTTLVGVGQSNVQQFFGIQSWPTDVAHYDLGGRVIDVIPIPGHEASHIALYDHGTDILFTGDTLYPGRLYVSNFSAYVASIQRLVDFTADKQVCSVLGTHIEMTSTPKQDFAYQSTYHPNEHPLPLTRDTLLELNDAVKAMQANPQQEAHDDFIIVP